MERKWVSEVYDKILAKEKKVAQRSRNKIPYTTKDGVFDDRGKTEICWWTNGFCLSGERAAHGDQTGRKPHEPPGNGSRQRL